mmetsp:Transcript_66114/g.141472  ORF Transcript_66114/g.141472 Transcript_66114/m.141472 type:complete len:137 (-) Transcript_66114:225-635(-)
MADGSHNFPMSLQQDKLRNTSALEALRLGCKAAVAWRSMHIMQSWRARCLQAAVLLKPRAGLAAELECSEKAKACKERMVTMSSLLSGRAQRPEERGFMSHGGVSYRYLYRVDRRSPACTIVVARWVERQSADMAG